MFNSCYDDNEDRNKNCRFKDVSPCRDFVSKYICNEHAAMFGIKYRLANYQDGNNDTWSAIESYVSSSANFNIPLFIEQNGEILISEIHSFALSVCNLFPNIRLEALKNTIACLMGINAYDMNCTTNGWLDEESTRVLIQDVNGVKASHLPPLHKILFYYAKPSTIKNLHDGSQVYLVPNVSLQYDLSNSTVSTYHFVIPNKKSMLKLTNKPNSVATPIVLNAIREVNGKHQARTFKPLTANGNFWC